MSRISAEDLSRIKWSVLKRVDDEGDTILPDSHFSLVKIALLNRIANALETIAKRMSMSAVEIAKEARKAKAEMEADAQKEEREREFDEAFATFSTVISARFAGLDSALCVKAKRAMVIFSGWPWVYGKTDQKPDFATMIKQAETDPIPQNPFTQGSKRAAVYDAWLVSRRDALIAEGIPQGDEK